MWRILRIFVKPRKKFLLRICLTFLTISFIFAFFVYILSPTVDLPPIYEPINDEDQKERYIIDIELRWIENLAAQKQSIRYVYNSSTKSKSLLFKSKCDCRNWETISVEQINEESDYLGNCYNGKTREEFKSRRFTCDLYSVFRRGKHQNVFSYNVFGKNSTYYYKIRDIAKQVKLLYPNWTIRVYSNGSLPKSILCKYECLFEDNVDFCLVDNVIVHPDLHINETHVSSWNASYIQPTMWRFLPFGDSFINVFASRDTDSYIIERERDSVNVWLKSGKLGHIMRDHPLHKVDILAGMWGFRFDKSRDLTEKIWERLIDRKIAKEYNPYKPNPYQSDQFWLKKYVWPEIMNNSVIHDSYDCTNHFGSSHWPTKRKGNCFVGAYGSCWEYARYFKCPINCRPKDHLDWIYC